MKHVIVVVLLAGLVGIKHVRSQRTIPIANEHLPVIGQPEYYNLSTSAYRRGTEIGFAKFEYDGHLWLWATVRNTRGGITHHPDCPCKE